MREQRTKKNKKTAIPHLHVRCRYSRRGRRRENKKIKRTRRRKYLNSMTGVGAAGGVWGGGGERTKNGKEQEGGNTLSA